MQCWSEGKEGSLRQWLYLLVLSEQRSHESEMEPRGEMLPVVVDTVLGPWPRFCHLASVLSPVNNVKSAADPGKRTARAHASYSPPLLMSPLLSSLGPSYIPSGP